MANRDTRFLIKRSNVPGKIPTNGDLLLGELGLNTADAILYTSGTTANTILPIGWDRVARTGDTMTGGLFTTFLSATTVSATTYLNLPAFTGDYLPLSGGTVYGPTIYSSGLTANTLNVTGLTQTSGITSTGGIIFPQKTLTSSYTATTADYFLNISGETLDVFLMPAVGVQGKLLVVKNEGSGIVNVISQFGELIDDRTDVLLTQGNSVQLISDGLNWVIIGYNISSTQANTGVISFSGLSKVTSSTFNVGPVQGYIVDDTTNPTIPFLTFVDYSGGVHTDNYVTSAYETFVYITSGGTIEQQPTPLTAQQRRQNIFLGKLGHPDKTVINLVFSQPDYVLTPLGQLRDMFIPINLINGGVYPSANTGLTINTNAGNIYGLGINFISDKLNPNTVYISGQTPCTFQYRTQTGGSITNTTLIDPLNYDLNGVITALSGTKATNQRIYLLQNGTFRIQYGQHIYSNFADAVQNLQTETFTIFPNFVNNAVLIGVLTLLSSTTDLTDTTKARFFFASKFGETVGATGGVSTTTLQQAYNNSTTPEITTNSILGALSIKNGAGTADNVTRLFEGQTGTNGITSVIYADGYISGTTLHTSGFTANSTGISASTVSATTIFTSGFTANTTGLSATTVSATTYYNLPSDTLQQVYTASTAPRITTNNTLGSLRVRGGTGTDTDNNFIIENNIGDVTSYWSANGDLVLQTISATTYYNLPLDVYVTGGSYNQISGIATFTNNTGGTFTVNGFSTGGGGSFTGGTVTGPTNFLDGLSANTISATTYYNLPIDVYVTGGTYSNGSTTFTNITGGTFDVTGYYTGSTDVYVTGGTYTEGVTTFTNTTGGTFNVTSTTTYAAGVISGSTGWLSTGTGQINLPNVKVALYNNANNIEPILIYNVASGTTNSGGIPALANNDTNYIVIEYNGGSPIYNVYDNDSIVNDSSVVLFMVVYRADNFIHTLEFGNQGAGLANKLNDRFIMTDRIGYESGLALGLSGSTGIVTSTAGVAWNGPNRQFLDPVNSQDDIFFKSFHSGGTWVYTTTGDTLNNTYYDDGTDIVLATAGKYLTNWYFRGQEINDHLYEVYSTNQYDSVALAQLSTEPVLPELITSHAILLGRIIVLVGANTGLTESAFVTTFQSTNVTAHNDLNAIQGGSAGQYYHLNANQYNNIALTNVDNNFSVGQTFNAGFTATTLSATTIVATTNTLVSLSATTLSGGTIYGDGSNITNIPTPYGIINALANFNFLT